MLFKKTSEVVEYAELNADTNFFSIKATIKNVEMQHIAPVLGRELYNSLNTAYALITDENSLTSAQKLLLAQCRSIIGPYLCFYYAPKADVKLSDSGMQRQETSSSKTAYQEQRIEFREANQREGESGVENLLAFLEENKASYPEWINSTAFAKYRRLFIKSGSEFDQFFSSHTPYRNYWAIRSKIEDVEENIIRPAISETLFDDLKAKDVSGTSTFTEMEAKLLFKLKKAIAYLSVSFAAPFLNVTLDANGITVMGPTRASRDDDAKRNAATDIAITNLIKSCNESGQTWLTNSLKFLNDNKTSFQTWSTLPPPAVTDELPFNAELDGSFGMC